MDQAQPLRKPKDSSFTEKIKRFFRLKKAEVISYLKPKKAEEITYFKSTKAEEVLDLTEICLSAITANFKRYITAFNDSQSDIPSLHFLFLARRFSETIFERLKNEGKLKSEHLELLLNPYITELDLQGIEKSLLPEIVDKMQAYGKGVQSLKIKPKDLKENLHEPLMSALPNVETLNFDGAPSLEMYEAIGRNCSLLRVLEIRHSCTDDFLRDGKCEGISFVMRNCPRLETLEHPDTIGALYKTHKNDEIFVGKETSIWEECPKYSLQNLSSTEREYPLQEALEVCSVICPHVTRLEIDELSSNEEINKISCFSLLEDLTITRCYKITMSCFNEFLKLSGSRLTNLEMPLARCLSIATLIECCPNLLSLTLSWGGSRGFCKRETSELSSKTTLPNLENVTLSGIPFELKGYPDPLRLLFSAARNVKKLDLITCSSLTNELVRSLDLYHIHELDLFLCDIEVGPLRELLLHGSLLTLNIIGCEDISANDCIDLMKYLPDEKRNTVDIKWNR